MIFFKHDTCGIKACLLFQSRRESSSVSRLSRSFSDISRELLQHAANMFRASATSEADASFVNPFSALEVIIDLFDHSLKTN